MTDEHHDFTGTVYLPERDTPYPLGATVTLGLMFGIDDGEYVVVDARVMSGSVDGPKFRGVAHISANPTVEVLAYGRRL